MANLYADLALRISLKKTPCLALCHQQPIIDEPQENVIIIHLNQHPTSV